MFGEFIFLVDLVMAGENPRKSPKLKSNSHPVRRGPDPHEFHHPHNKIHKDKDRSGQLPSKTSGLDSIKSPILPQPSSSKPNLKNNNNITVIRKPTGDDKTRPSAKDQSKASMESSSQVKKQEVTKKKGGSSNAKEREKKVYSLPGQKHDPPEERDPLRIFYESLYEQIPTSEMATIWMMEHGLLPLEVAKKAFERKQKKQQQQRTGTPIKSSSVAEKSM